MGKWISNLRFNQAGSQDVEGRERGNAISYIEYEQKVLYFVLRCCCCCFWPSLRHVPGNSSAFSPFNLCPTCRRQRRTDALCLLPNYEFKRFYNLILMAFPLFMSATFLPMLSLSAFMPFRQTFNLFSCLLARLRLHLRLRQSQFHESHVNKPCERNFARPMQVAAVQSTLRYPLNLCMKCQTFFFSNTQLQYSFYCLYGKLFYTIVCKGLCNFYAKFSKPSSLCCRVQ